MSSDAAVLSRELTDISSAVRRVPAPPTPKLSPPNAIRVADPDGSDADMISEWMNRPHLAKAWEYDWPPARWRRHLRAQVDGTYSRPLVLSLSGTDRGYLEIYRAAKDSIAPRYDSEPHDIGLHGAIADEQLVNRGLGPLLLGKIVASVLDAEPDCQRIMFDPDHRNTTVRGLCEFMGCRFLGEHDMSNRRMALYALDRAATSR
ncbi:GNAT family N-acetyltransferase [Candidatus Mycobacterium wuenschmannii]|uniref:Lysine N-acyltransferase MbtK n=1 Tax=Candidatus Mycobacterium wuenschmannii TaxID=3027808 RepID=A0ABY8W307_9MYCO|nr:GNAT family N-acetyltransferase [Candidatus Mycobacterium wuenschmannii]WIM89384.1 GNAT family N-acetyltransferase [Candidatus Mycobacterium wuenschmannii]